MIIDFDKKSMASTKTYFQKRLEHKTNYSNSENYT